MPLSELFSGRNIARSSSPGAGEDLLAMSAGDCCSFFLPPPFNPFSPFKFIPKLNQLTMLTPPGKSVGLATEAYLNFC